MGIILTNMNPTFEKREYHNIYQHINYQPAVSKRFRLCLHHSSSTCFTHVFALSAAHKPRGQGEARLGAGDREHRMEPGLRSGDVSWKGSGVRLATCVHHLFIFILLIDAIDHP